MQSSRPISTFAPIRRLTQNSAPLGIPLFFLSVLCWTSSGVAATADDLVSRRDQVQNLSLSEQQRLARNQERFEALSVTEQDRVRKLYAELSSDPNADELRTVLERYHEWLKTLLPEQRAELAELGADERIARIRQLMAREREEQERRRRRYAGTESPLPQADLKIIVRWFGDIVWQHREELLAGIPQGRREQLEKQDEAWQRRALMVAAVERWRRTPLPFEPEEFDKLVKKLSPETQMRFTNAEGPQRERLSREILWQAVMNRMGSNPWRRSMAMVSSEEQQKFFQNELPEEDRQRLMNLPRDQMRDELRTLYLRHIRESTGGRPMGRPPGPPYGPRGDRDRPRRPPGEGRGRPDRGRDGFSPDGRDRNRPPFGPRGEIRGDDDREPPNL